VNPKTVVLTLLSAGAAFCSPHLALSETSAARVQAKARAQVEIRRETQKLSDHYAEKRLGLTDRIDELQKELKATKQQREKTGNYVADMEARVAELKRRALELERMGKELEPFLDQAGQELQDIVSRDLPFLADEREKRMKELSRTLNRYGAPAGTKLRIVLETLEIEARYGSTVSCRETEMNINGARELVRVFRLGRLALFAIASDGSRAWRYDRGQAKYLPLEGYQAELNRAADMAARKKVIELVELPVGKAGGRIEAEE